MTAGRPLKFNSPQEILDKGMQYFLECQKEGKPRTVTGLCIALGTFRNVLMDYEDIRGEEFSNAVKYLKLHCENYAEEQAFIGKNPTAAIFALKNYGWKDKSDESKDQSILTNQPSVNMMNFDDILKTLNEPERQKVVQRLFGIEPHSTDSTTTPENH